MLFYHTSCIIFLNVVITGTCIIHGKSLLTNTTVANVSFFPKMAAIKKILSLLSSNNILLNIFNFSHCCHKHAVIDLFLLQTGSSNNFCCFYIVNVNNKHV